ncbi:MAG: antibiotic biosynthesis monooxygenase [Candidatus Acidiferrales bacterium]
MSVTRLRVRALRFMPEFIVYVLRSLRQVRRSSGFLGGALMRDDGKAFWTVTVWTDAKAMEDYRIAGIHRAAMPKLLNWCDEASVVHWTPDSADVPSWPQACGRMVAEGRASKVNNPSPAHLAFRIPGPKPGRFTIRLRPVQRSA